MKIGLVLVAIWFGASAYAADSTKSTKCYWGIGQKGAGPISDNAWTELTPVDNSSTRNFFKEIASAGQKYTVRAQVQYAVHYDLTLLDYTISKEGPKGFKPLVAANSVFLVAASVVADDGQVALKCE